jgi:2',3'-cyclic-nucleotide 2'-phosphodiesterase (5'-nucleotidase family)
MKKNNLSNHSVILLALLLLISSACVNQKVVLTALVKNEADEPAQGLKGKLQNKDKFQTAWHFKHATTKENGILKLKVNPNQSYILEIKGEQGAGRIFLPPEKLSDTIHITYPIKEKIVFLHNNDLHFDLNLMEEFTQKVNEIRAEYDDVYLFSAGDIFVRHPHRWIDNDVLKDTAWYIEKSMSMVNEMNKLNYDLMTLGNHELDYIGNYTGEALAEARFPLLTANFEISTDKLPAVAPYSILETSTLRNVTVLGLSTGGSEEAGIVELDLNKTINKYISLKDDADAFLILSHRGLNEDKIIAEKFPQFDAIIGGHSHNLLEKALFINSVLIAQAGGNPHVVSRDHPVYLGIVIITLENGKITEKNGSVVRIVSF